MASREAALLKQFGSAWDPSKVASAADLYAAAASHVRAVAGSDDAPTLAEVQAQPVRYDLVVGCDRFGLTDEQLTRKGG